MMIAAAITSRAAFHAMTICGAEMMGSIIASEIMERPAWRSVPGVGALAGSELAGRGDRTLGAIIGAVGGGLIGREIDRGSLSCR